VPDPTELVDLARRLAAEASALQREALSHARTAVGTKSTSTDMVTETDRASERLIVERLRAERPGDGVLAEEGTAEAGTTGVRWIVDPLDGTTNFLYGLPSFGPSIAVEVDGVVVAGVVIDTGRGEVFDAVLGGGARLDGRPIACNHAGELATALVATGFSYDAGRRARQAEVLGHVLPRVRDIRRLGAAAIDLCWVACGRVDAFYERGLAAWDRAAGCLIAAEAGAVVDGSGDGGPPGALTVAARGSPVPCARSWTPPGPPTRDPRHTRTGRTGPTRKKSHHRHGDVTSPSSRAANLSGWP
jgi:myo-inositol-1(or 4)-monophosphatase